MIQIFSLMLTRQIVTNAMKVSLVVGTCLNLINEGDALWQEDQISLGKIAMNFVVPYLVASYSGAKAKKSCVLIGNTTRDIL